MRNSLEELYYSNELLNEGLLSLEYPIYRATDDEIELFLGKIVKSVSKAIPKPITRTISSAARTVGQGVKTVGKAVNTVNKFIPQQVWQAGLSFTPVGMAVKAGLGAASAAASGKNVFQGALRTIAADPVSRAMIDTAAGAARGENVLKAAKYAAKSGIADVKQSLQFAAMVAPFVPGIGTGVGAALAAANALASGEKITDALIAAAKNAVPGGAIAQTAFDTAVNLAKGKNIAEAALAAARSKLPGGPAAQAAFDTALALAKGQKIQDAIIAGGARFLPKSPYSADVLSFVKKAANGEHLGKAALSTVGNMVVKRIEKQGAPIFSKARQAYQQASRFVPQSEISFTPETSGTWFRKGQTITLSGV